MKKNVAAILLTFLLLLILSPVALAEEAEAVAKGTNIDYYKIAVLACGIAIGVAAFGCGIGQGIGTAKACEGIARNPGASGKVTTSLIIGLAMIESLTIYALVVALIVLFVNPFGKLLH